MSRLKLFIFVALSLLTVACATNQVNAVASPESQIVTGANAASSATRLVTTLLASDKITVQQATSYRDMLVAARDSLKAMDATLKSCRARTASSQASAPDPCALGVADVIRLALGSVLSIQQVLSTK
jgi:hypothetical protein